MCAKIRALPIYPIKCAQFLGRYRIVFGATATAIAVIMVKNTGNKISIHSRYLSFLCNLGLTYVSILFACRILKGWHT